jgi:hypothetical protein
MSEEVLRFPSHVRDALGDSRIRRLADLQRRIAPLNSLTVDVGTTEVVLAPMDRPRARRWERLAADRGEDWVFAKSEDASFVLAVDEPSEQGMADPAAAVMYPEIHTRLVTWWLIHTWRALDLIQDTLENLRTWRITSGAVTARAVIEEAGCLTYEAVQLVDAWQVGKATRAGETSRPSKVREVLGPILGQAAFGSRITGWPAKARATSVLTYVKRLAKLTADDRYETWYDWLSDAAHPAFGARIALSTPPMVHDSGAVMVRVYARAPLGLYDAEGVTTGLENDIAFHAADALIACGAVINEVLDQALLLVDDFGLTTGAATLTRRQYWRNFAPTRGNRPCPCGRGKWSVCRHWWGAPAPTLRVPSRSQTANARPGASDEGRQSCGGS